jgi:hypothetical protein
MRLSYRYDNKLDYRDHIGVVAFIIKDLTEYGSGNHKKPTSSHHQVTQLARPNANNAGINRKNTKHSKKNLWKHVFEDIFLRRCQAGREPNYHMNNQVASFARLLRYRHALAWELFLVAGLRGTGLRYPNRFSIDCTHDPFPAGKGFLQANFNCRDKVVALAFEVRMFFLYER